MSTMHIDFKTWERYRLTGEFGKLWIPEGFPPLPFYRKPDPEIGWRVYLADGWAFEDDYAPDQCDKCLGNGGHDSQAIQNPAGDIIVSEIANNCAEYVAFREAVQLLPAACRWVDYRSLAPFPGIAIPIPVQEELIEKVCGGSLEGHSCLFAGPARTSKTVLVSALLTWMYVSYRRKFCSYFWEVLYLLPFYRVNCPEWLAQQSAWEYHDFDSESPRPPQPQPNLRTIGKLRSRAGYDCSEPCPAECRPVILLEEIDKFHPTEARLNNLFALLNKIFEAGGMIISTTNLSKSELKERFPDWFYRRLVESSRDGKVRLFDLHDSIKLKPPKRKVEL